MMYKDVYKSANEQIKISETARVLALDKINSGGRKVRYSYLVAIPLTAIVLVTALTLLPKGMVAPLPQSAQDYSIESTNAGAAMVPSPQVGVEGAAYGGVMDAPANGDTAGVGILGTPNLIAADSSPQKDGRSVQFANSSFVNNVQSFSYSSAAKVFADDGKDSDKNKVYSPTSLYMALEMLASGAVGETQDELLAVMSISDSTTLYKESNEFFNSVLFEDENGQCLPANSVWFNNSYNLNQSAIDNLTSNHYASVFSADFAEKSASQAMSDWVSSNTGGKLGTDPSAFEFDGNTAMALFNTLYFNQQWINEFGNDAVKSDFTLADKTTVKADYMHEKTDANYIKTDKSLSYSRSFKNGSKMTFILPSESVPLSKFMSQPDSIKQALDTEKSERATVDFTMPKFDFNTSMELTDVMKSMGVSKVFDSKTADFSAFTDTQAVWVSQVKQDATISVDEKGCEAAAFTSIALTGAGAPEKLDNVEISLDRPFAFVISDRSDIPLFIGTVNNPTLNK